MKKLPIYLFVLCFTIPVETTLSELDLAEKNTAEIAFRNESKNQKSALGKCNLPDETEFLSGNFCLDSFSNF